ncbi:MAG: RsbRD N-terminal domain-containing protein, partial [Deltaproteobacteria bacterium]|nr:RsbRD N-terminal domain-containing protein [Candidatus Anaeroferrophillacea bacterium]
MASEISQRYRTVPREQLVETVSRAFDGNLAVICRQDWEPIGDFIVYITRLRLERGFTLSEVQRAFGLFRRMMIDRLPFRFG